MEWQPITTYPDRPMKVLFYSSKAQWTNHITGEVVEVPEIQAVRYEVGYWDGKMWRESGTNHDVFEFDYYMGHPDKPTHWMPLPKPPITTTKDGLR